ncbi:GNAT family acetyltransferase [Chryseobacterium piperi]|uniref:GNAT family acetyltransferase n=1 Tax=Chryseobacterium piperi TaxID=558152 RepID=A0A086BL54_9FLAO|nr:GNAT family N-acetyltransferase [Chryseobacterium piperi]ASW74626.1 N-acetyltransferase [Chryseobacterium piperi]KFF29668.1 GNAT family acetyltransferase [Chryseobacterium piperi]
MVSLHFYKPEDFSGVNYTLDEQQSQYTSTAEFALQRIEERNDGQGFSVTIFEDEKPAGYFVLDFGDDKLELTDNPNSALLRSLSINPELQGRGIGKTAMIKVDDFVRENFKDCDEIVLAVNQNNTSAYDLYLKVGYSFDGKTRMGRSGTQYLMYKKL